MATCQHLDLFESVDPQHMLDNFLQFAYSSGGFKPRRSFLQLIWLCGVYVLWNEMNRILFSNKVKSIMQLLENVKVTSLNWLKAKNICFTFGYHLWWQQLLVSLGIG